VRYMRERGDSVLFLPRETHKVRYTYISYLKKCVFGGGNSVCHFNANRFRKRGALHVYCRIYVRYVRYMCEEVFFFFLDRGDRTYVCDVRGRSLSLS